MVRSSFELRYRARLAKIIIGKSGYLRILSRAAIQTRKLLDDKAKKYEVGNKSLKEQDKEMEQTAEVNMKRKSYASFYLRVLVFSAFLYAVTLPLELAFYTFPSTSDEGTAVLTMSHTMNILIDVFWGLDLLRFFVPKQADDLLLSSYWTNRFILDIFAAFPYYRLEASSARLFSLVGWLSLFRFAKVVYILDILRDSKRSNSSATSWKRETFYLVVSLFLIIHWYTCLLYDSLSYSEFRKETFSSAYKDSFYYSAMLLTGGISNENLFQSFGRSGTSTTQNLLNSEEKFIVSFGAFLSFVVMLVGVAFTTTIVISMSSASQEMKKHVAELEAYMDFRRLPMPMRRTLRECYARKWESHKYFDENSVLASLNAHTRKQVLAYTMNRALLNLPFLRQTSERFRNKLVFRMKEHTYPSGHLIAQGNTDASELRIILHGAVEFRDFNDNVVLTLAENTYFGDQHLFEKESVEPCDIVSISGTRLYSLSRNSFVTVLCSFPQYQTQIIEWGKRRAAELPFNTRLSNFDGGDADDNESSDAESTTGSMGEETKNEANAGSKDAIDNGAEKAEFTNTTERGGEAVQLNERIDQIQEQFSRFEDVLETLTSKVNRLLLYNVSKGTSVTAAGSLKSIPAPKIKPLVNMQKSNATNMSSGYSISMAGDDGADDDYGGISVAY
jgi:hyperpolarization activated cyclic nucleotide-gated potassium channel 2